MTKAKTKTVPNTHPRGYVHNRETGGETPDPTPVHIPGKCQMPLSLRDDMRRFIKEELSKQVQSDEVESFEESNDFEEENPDIDMLSAYTVTALQPEPDQPHDDLDGKPTEADEKPRETLSLATGGEAAEAEGETPAPSPVSQPPIPST